MIEIYADSVSTSQHSTLAVALERNSSLQIVLIVYEHIIL